MEKVKEFIDVLDVLLSSNLALGRQILVICLIGLRICFNFSPTEGAACIDEGGVALQSQRAYLLVIEFCPIIFLSRH